MRLSVGSAGLALAILLAGCSEKGAPGAGDEAPDADEPSVHGTRSALARPIPVRIDGEPATALDAARLEALGADFIEKERRAWNLTALLPAYADADALLEVTSEDGVSTVYPSPASGKLGDKAPVLTVDRKGRAVLTLVTAEDPFPSFHGRGGNRGRPGDPAPRVHDVERLSVRHPGSGTGKRSGERP